MHATIMAFAVLTICHNEFHNEWNSWVAFRSMPAGKYVITEAPEPKDVGREVYLYRICSDITFDGLKGVGIKTRFSPRTKPNWRKSRMGNYHLARFFSRRRKTDDRVSQVLSYASDN